MKRYEKWEDWMVGKSVKHELDKDDPGIVVGPIEDGVVAVNYENEGLARACLHYLIFEDENEMQEITINGQRYKLVKIED